MANHTNHPSDHPGNRTNHEHNSKIKSHHKLALMREIAESKQPQSVLAVKYGVTQGTISQFKTKHASQIQAIQADFENEFAGLWIAKKTNRIQEYMNQVELINEQLQSDPAPRNIGTLLRYAQIAIRSVAEELGALTQKVESTNKTTYTVEGVDVEKLK
jgi:hypothetical protein